MEVRPSGSRTYRVTSPSPESRPQSVTSGRETSSVCTEETANEITYEGVTDCLLKRR